MVQTVTVQSRYDFRALDAVAKAAFGASAGVSVGPYGSSIHIGDGQSAGQAQVVLDAFGTLASIVLDKAQITADDVDTATITITTADPDLAWVLVDGDGDVVGQGVEAAVAGEVTLTFATDIPDTYTVWLMRRVGDFACASVEIEAVV